MAMNSLEITLKTITPIWTGGTDGKADRLHITGIMGSLRWWYEVMIRSIGGHVCDPSKHSCIYDISKPYAGLCDVCSVFGATGWARRFRLIICQDDLQPKKPTASRIDGSGRLVLTLSGDHPSGHKWYLTGNPLYGQMKLGLIPTGPMDKKDKEFFDPAIIGALFQFIAEGLNNVSNGTIEPLVGRETGNDADFGKNHSHAKICWTPGSIIDAEKTLQIQARGIWEELAT